MFKYLSILNKYFPACPFKKTSWLIWLNGLQEVVQVINREESLQDEELEEFVSEMARHLIM